MAITGLTAAEFQEKYSDSILLKRLTDDNDSGAIIEDKITTAITEAIDTIELDLEVDSLDSDVFKESRIKFWICELAYYFLFSRIEYEKVAYDKLELVMSQLEKAKKSLKEKNDPDYTDGYYQTAEEELLPESTIEEWE